MWNRHIGVVGTDLVRVARWWQSWIKPGTKWTKYGVVGRNLVRIDPISG